MSAAPAGVDLPPAAGRGVVATVPSAVLLVAALLAAALSGGAGGAAAQQVSPGAGASFRAGASVRPAVAELGEKVAYRGWVVSDRPVWGRWLAPETSATFTWGAPSSMKREGWGRRRVEGGRRRAFAGRDTLLVEIPLQAFAIGRLEVPGPRIEIDDGRGARVYRLPLTRLTVAPVLTAADSHADFRALHGPLAAPWWERVPWAWVGLATLVAAAGLMAWRLRPRGPAVAPAPASARRDPLAEALAALAALQGRRLPQRGRFAEHAFALGQILRRYLEEITGVIRPGDTTPELVAHLRQAGLEREDLERLGGLLRAWDRVKFAREPFTQEEALRGERATEAFLRRAPAAKAA